MFKKIELRHFYRLISHGPCVLVTSGDNDKSNIAPMAWITPVNSEPPLVGIPLPDNHYTTELINARKEFAINIPGNGLIDAIMYTGKASGRSENKFKMSGLTPESGILIATPHIKECAGFIECRVKDRHLYNGMTLFIADVLYAAADDELFDESWITERVKTIHHLGGSYFAVIGKRFKAH